MAHLQYMPGDPRLVDQLVYELKSKGIFDQFRKECIADVDTRPAYQNLRQRVETSVSTFLSRQCWQPDLNKNQLREKLRKHILDGNYLEQGVERIVDQVVNPKVASVFIPQVEDLVYNYLGITRKKSTPATETSSNGKVEDLLPTDLEAVSPGSVKSNDDKNEIIEISDETKDDSKMEVDDEASKPEIKEDPVPVEDDKEKEDLDIPQSGASEMSIDNNNIPLPEEPIKLENIQPPENSPPKIELDKIELPKEIPIPADIPMPDEIFKIEKDNIPLPDDIPKPEKDQLFKPVQVNSDDDDASSSDSSLRRNMSPLTPIRNFNNENSYDAQQAFENDSGDSKSNEKKEPSTFRFTIESKSSENSSDGVKIEKKEAEQASLSYQFNNQVNINTFHTPLYDDSSNSNNLQIDYESDANSKINIDVKVPEPDHNSEDSKKGKKTEEKRSSHKSSHRSRDSHRHSSSKEQRSDSKHSSRDISKNDRKSSKDDNKPKSSHKDSSKDKGDKKDSRDSSKHKSSHRSSSHSHRDTKSHKSSSQRHSSKYDDRKSDDKRSSSSLKEKSEKISDKGSSSKEKSSKDSKSSSHRSDKDRKSSSKKNGDKEREKKDKKDVDDHYSLSGRGNNNRRSTDRDSNDGSSCSKGSNNPPSSKSSENKKDTKSSSKSDNTSTCSDSTSPSDADHVIDKVATDANYDQQPKPIVRVETHLETPYATPPRLPFVPDVTLKKPKFAANLQEAKRLMKMRKFLDEEQKRMNQEAALLLEFQANVRPSLSQVYSSIPGPELEFACVLNPVEHTQESHNHINDTRVSNDVTLTMEHVQENNEIHEITQAQDVTHNPIEEFIEDEKETRDIIAETLTAMHQEAGVTCHIQGIGQSQYAKNASDIAATLEEKQLSEFDDDKNKSQDQDVSKYDENANADITEMLNSKDRTDMETNGNKSLQDDKEVETKVIETERINEPMQANIEFEPELSGAYIENAKKPTEFEVTIITEELSDTEDCEKVEETAYLDIQENCPEEIFLHYFAEREKYDSEIERNKFNSFLKTYIEHNSVSNKMYLINCDSYEENIIKEVSKSFGQFEIVTYYKNGHLKMPKSVVKDINVANEISLPLDRNINDAAEWNSHVSSPVKSECSFELSSDYDARLEEMVNKTSRQEIMEIILGSAIDESPTKMPTIDYCMDSSIDEDLDNPLKRKMEVESSVNNNRPVLTPNKIRKLSGSDQISSTTEESERTNKAPNNTRSKYLGRAKRVGLPRPKRTNLPNSPSSDKSVENYEQESQVTEQSPNGKIRTPQRKVQRYDTSDLYKPKLHYLSRRNNIT